MHRKLIYLVIALEIASRSEGTIHFPGPAITVHIDLNEGNFDKNDAVHIRSKLSFRYATGHILSFSPRTGFIFAPN